MKRLAWAATLLAAAACRPQEGPPAEPRWPAALVDGPVYLCVFEPPPHWEEREREPVPCPSPGLVRDRPMHDVSRVPTRPDGSN